MSTSDALSARALRELWDQARSWHLKDPVSRETSEDDVSRETEHPFPRQLMDPELLAVEWPPALWDLLEHYARTTLEANRRLNLVSRRDPVAQIRVNLLDSLPLACLWPRILKHVSRETSRGPGFILDAGSGSGVPGIPVLGTLRYMIPPESVPSLFLIESRGVKAEFLQGLIESLGLNEAAVHRGRLEDPELLPWLDEQAPDRHGVLCARALASVTRVLEWSKQLRERLEGALFIKGSPGLGREWSQEGSRWPKRGWRAEEVISFRGLDREIHHLWMRPRA